MSAPDPKLRFGLQTISESQLVRVLESAEHFPVCTAIAGASGETGKVVILEGTQSQLNDYLAYLQAVELVAATLTVAVAER